MNRVPGRVPPNCASGHQRLDLQRSSMSLGFRTTPSTSPAARVHGYVGLKARRRLLGALLLAGLGFGIVALIVAYRARPRFHAPSEAPQPLPENAERAA